MATATLTATADQFSYPATMKVFGMVVDDHLASAVIKIGLEALSKVDADLLVFLCIPPHDLRARTDWTELRSHIRVGNRTDDEAYEIRVVNSPEELLYASLNMRILQLPDDTAVVRM